MKIKAAMVAALYDNENSIIDLFLPLQAATLKASRH
jgi:hypothetical protein